MAPLLDLQESRPPPPLQQPAPAEQKIKLIIRVNGLSKRDCPFLKTKKKNAIKLKSQAGDNETLGDNRRGWRAAFSPLRVKLHLPQTERSESFAASALEFVEKNYESFISSLIRGNIKAKRSTGSREPCVSLWRTFLMLSLRLFNRLCHVTAVM